MNTTRIQPLGFHVLVQLDEAPAASGSIIIPDNARKAPPDRGTVLAVGGDVHEVAAGDVVFFRAFAGLQIPDEPRLKMVEEAEVIAAHVEKAEPPRDVIEWVRDWAAGAVAAGDDDLPAPRPATDGIEV